MAEPTALEGWAAAYVASFVTKYLDSLDEFYDNDPPVTMDFELPEDAAFVMTFKGVDEGTDDRFVVTVRKYEE